MTPDELEASIRLEMNRLRGKLAGYIEAIDLDERKERNIISTMKSLSYDAEQKLVNLIAPGPVK